MKAFLWLGILLAGGLMLLLQPEVIRAQKKTPGTDEFQPLDFQEASQKLVSIEPVSMARRLVRAAAYVIKGGTLP